jgi:hypothetical protein
VSPLVVSLLGQRHDFMRIIEYEDRQTKRGRDFKKNK